MIDVHVLHTPTHRRWHEECRASLQGAPIRVHAIDGSAPDFCLGTARAQGFSLGSSEFVSYVDDDDVVVPFAFEKCLRVLRGSPELAGVYTDEILVDEIGGFVSPGVSIDPAPFVDWLPLLRVPGQPGQFMHHLVVFRRAAIEPHLKGMEGRRIPEPYLIAKAGSFARVPGVGYFWRIHPRNTFSGFSREEIATAAAELERC